MLQPVRDSYATGTPVAWVKVHNVPDYAYFNHSAHVNRGVSCVSCHGQVNEMNVVYQDKSQSMAWCLTCHRNPQNEVRPLSATSPLAPSTRTCRLSSTPVTTPPAASGQVAREP